MNESSTGADRQRLRGRRIMLTGAASGIGKAIAELFHAEGAQLALIDRDAEGLAAVAAALNALPVLLDLGDSESIAPAVERLASEMGGLDGVVNCAGIGMARTIEETDLTVLSNVLATNLVAPYLLCRAALPHLRQADGSTVVNIASAQALLPNAPNATAYSTSKGGLVAFTKALAAEVAPRVRANVLCPGVTASPMTAPLFAGYANPSDAPWVQQYALKRVAAPIEIARGALYLTSDESSFVTGVALAVDGGRSFH